MNAKRFTSLLLLIAITISLGTPANAISNEPQKNYIEIDVPIDMLLQQIRATNPLVATIGTMSAYFSPGQTTALSAACFIDFRDDSIPINAQITNVTVSASRSIYSNGIIYYIAIGKMTPWGTDWCPDLPLVNGTASTSWFNGEDPWGMWTIELYTTRVIIPPDYGATAILTYVTLRIYWE